MRKLIPVWEPTTLEFPESSGPGRHKKAKSERVRKIENFLIKTILEIQKTIDFTPGSRGWCYLLEQHGLKKGDFSRAEKVIGDARKDGRLPLDICSDDTNRSFQNIEKINRNTPREEAREFVEWIIESDHENYIPFSFWDTQEYYIEVVVEKIDLIQLFKGVCATYHVPIANSRGWPDLNMRAEMMKRFQYWERRDHNCILLLCGDHDPAGLLISKSYRKMLNDLKNAVGWSPKHLLIERFGLNEDLINEENLSWIENLMTSKNRDLKNSKEKYVQEYIKKYGVRKVEANALVTRPNVARNLIESTLNKYISKDSVRSYNHQIKIEQLEVKRIISEMVNQ